MKSDLSYREWDKLLKSNPILAANYLQWKAKIFSKEIVLNGTLSKTTKHALSIRFQKKFTWIFNAQNIQDKVDMAYLIL